MLERVTPGHTIERATLGRIWEGSFGRSGHTARLLDDRIEQRLGMPGERTMLVRAEGIIDDPSSGYEIGRFKRSLERTAAGDLVAHHDLLELAPDARKTGFGMGFHNHALAGYRQLGINRVETLASDVGGYAWAKAGFEFASTGVNELEHASSRAQQAFDVVHMARIFDQITPAEFDRLLPRLMADGVAYRPGMISTTRELVDLGGLGKRILLGSGWNGVLHLR